MKPGRLPKTTVLAVALTLAFALHGLGATHYVDPNSTNSVAPYTTWATAATSIQQALGSAFGSDTVLVTNGVYQSGGFSGSRVSVPASVTVRSVNGPEVTFIAGYQVPGTTNGPAAIRCAYLNNGATLSGFTLTNGATAYGEAGGGVKCASAACTVSNCVLAGNVAANVGGGAYSGTLIHCVLSNNVSASGGAANNSILLNCVLAGNSSSYRGGGAANSSLTNCVLTGNYADAYGGGADSSVLVNCTVVSNTAHYAGGGSEAGTALNSILYHNALVATGFTSTNYDGGSITNCCAAPLPNLGSANISNSPLFSTSFHLSAASPCVNAGNNAFISASTDLEGNPRIVGGTVDIGVYEFSSPHLLMNLPARGVSGLILSWQSVSGKTYFLQRATNLAAQPAFSTLQTNIIGQPGTTAYTDQTAAGPGPFFYRVGVQ